MMISKGSFRFVDESLDELLLFSSIFSFIDSYLTEIIGHDESE